MLQEQETTATTDLVPEGASVFLRSIHPINLLSFGPDTPEIALGPLNVLIGANGSGKSNLIEVVCLLRSTERSMEAFFKTSGGFSAWIHKGEWKGVSNKVSAVVSSRYRSKLLRYDMLLSYWSQGYNIDYEGLYEVQKGNLSVNERQIFTFTGFLGEVKIDNTEVDVEPSLIEGRESILSQFRDPIRYNDITYLAAQYARIFAYREWSFGRNTVFRTPQRADMRTDRLEEDFSNLGLFLNKLRRDPQAKRAILTHLRDLYEGVDDYDVSIEGGTVQVFLTEGNITIPATRLSDGTLRYLCLLAILCDPTPPPLICIEEPELGLHPDILPKIADLLVEASTRTQLIVTTHSDILIDAMTERPESVLVCEKHDGQTQIKRLSRDDLGEWLQKYRLGELWTRGEIGGTRW